MPEIAEIARIVHFIRKHLAGKTLAKVTATDDPSVYGKVGTSAAEFQKHMTGKKILDAGQQGKYFWMVMSSPPHPVMHFGMTGWLKMRGEETYYYRKKEGEADDEEWPPKYWKFNLETKEEPKVEAAFVDFRRFARIRLVDCPAEQLRKTTPLVENGPDPVQDKDIVTVEWLKVSPFLTCICCTSSLLLVLAPTLDGLSRAQVIMVIFLDACRLACTFLFPLPSFLAKLRHYPDSDSSSTTSLCTQALLDAG
jgi:Formamidopyrimidine-DNA glycosylase N-terminal domain